MSIKDVEAVLIKAFTLYGQQGPEQKKEIQTALDVLLEKMSSANAIISECQEALQTCLAMINVCPIATLRIS
jgi:hypothetical protein